MLQYDFLVIGGGAAGFFAAINVKLKNPSLKVGILEKQGRFLQKVKVSGGGRCNVTNEISEPEALAANYPRGQAFLKESFQKFNSADTKKWFSDRGVKLKTEADGRVFPVSDSSQTIIDCFLKAAYGIDLLLNSRVENITKVSSQWSVKLADERVFTTRFLMIATGSDKKIWEELEKLDLKINTQVPSLFTFNIADTELHALQGVSFAEAKISVRKTDLVQKGPLLITHWGLSGPAILKLSAWGAYLLKEKDYCFEIAVNWLPHKKASEIESELKTIFLQNPKKNIRSLHLNGITQRFWNYICSKSEITEFQKGAESGKKQINSLVLNLTSSVFAVNGKSTFKEEFVTAGGIDLSEVDSLSFSSHRYSNLYFGGEVLDIDAITGGFNFQAAWTAGWLVSESILKK